MRWKASVLAGLLMTMSGMAPAATPLMTCDRALAMVGEETAAGGVAVGIVPAPDLPGNLHTLRLSFRLQAHRERDWLDASCQAVPIDFSASSTIRLWIRAEQVTDYLYLKLVDPDNPGRNHAAFEEPLLLDGGPLPAGRWLALELSLPEEVTRRDGLTYLGFFLSASNSNIPLGRDLVFYIGQFPYDPPPRPPWPPPPRTSGKGVFSSILGPETLHAGGPWILVDGRDNQTDHVAEFKDGGVEFLADAEGWNEFLWSDPERLVLAPSRRYRLRFDYRVTAPLAGAGAMFYSLIRAQGTIREDVGWQRWDGMVGTQGSRMITFTTHAAPGYRVTFGIRHRGGIRLDHIRLEEEVVSEGGAR